MKEFLNEDFLLETKTSQVLYHGYAQAMPIIDYHCHLPPADIANDTKFENITRIWLNGDHYKWRAMRAHGIPEKYITGDASDFEKFSKWAECVPYTVRNPLYHWTHLELKRYFDISDILSPATAKKIYDECSEKLGDPRFSVKNLMLKMQVEFTGTTDDPLDDLQHHDTIKKDGFGVRVNPTFRPDKAMNTESSADLNIYVNELAEITGVQINNFDSYLGALRERHDFFASMDCKVSDHGVAHLYADTYTSGEIEDIFQKIRNGGELTCVEERQFKSCLLYQFALWDNEKGWVQQFHLGALRKTNTRLLSVLGPDTGFDSIGDYPQAGSLYKFLDKLDADNRLAKTIIYNLNPADNEVFASMAGNYQDGSVPGKIQFGSAWWFLDQKDGMTRQMNALSNCGLLSHFIGMLTDSRSFLSYPRHEYFRRILCNLLGSDVENGELPNDVPWLGKIVQDICYYNAKAYFGL